MILQQIQPMMFGRQLHHDRPMGEIYYTGTNTSLKAKVNGKGECIIYNETLEAHYNRVAVYFSKCCGMILWSDDQFLEIFGVDKTLYLYGLGSQAGYGDAPSESGCGWLDIPCQYLYSAWDDYRGWS